MKKYLKRRIKYLHKVKEILTDYEPIAEENQNLILLRTKFEDILSTIDYKTSLFKNAVPDSRLSLSEIQEYILGSVFQLSCLLKIFSAKKRIADLNQINNSLDYMLKLNEAQFLEYSRLVIDKSWIYLKDLNEFQIDMNLLLKAEKLLENYEKVIEEKQISRPLKYKLLEEIYSLCSQAEKMIFKEFLFVEIKKEDPLRNQIREKILKYH